MTLTRWTILLLVALAACGCGKRKSKAPSLDAQRVARPTTAIAATTQAASELTASPTDGSLNEAALLQFLQLSDKIMKTPRLAGDAVVRSPEDFSALAQRVAEIDQAKPLFQSREMGIARWSLVGARAWSAWSVAQVDFNAEAPLRDSADHMAAAKLRLAAAQTSAQSGAVDLSPQERARISETARNAATNALDRAELCQTRADRLREELDRLNESPAPDSGRLQTQASIQQAMGAALQDASAAREAARTFAATAQHPEASLTDADKSTRKAQVLQSIDEAREEVRRCEEERTALQTRLDEDRRADAEARNKTAPPGDIALLRRHLAQFNAVWSLTVQGTPAPTPQLPTSASTRPAESGV